MTSHPTSTRTGPKLGRAHQLARLRWAPLVATGTITCRRCGHPIRPGQAWDLGHPADAPRALGNPNHDLAPEHRTCNRAGLLLDNEPTFTW